MVSEGFIVNSVVIVEIVGSIVGVVVICVASVVVGTMVSVVAEEITCDVSVFTGTVVSVIGIVVI